MPAFQSVGQHKTQLRKVHHNSGEQHGGITRPVGQNCVVARDDQGNVIGAVVAPVDDAVFGFGRGSVYLLREH